MDDIPSLLENVSFKHNTTISDIINIIKCLYTVDALVEIHTIETKAATLEENLISTGIETTKQMPKVSREAYLKVKTFG